MGGMGFVDAGATAAATAVGAATCGVGVTVLGACVLHDASTTMVASVALVVHSIEAAVGLSFIFKPLILWVYCAV